MINHEQQCRIESYCYLAGIKYYDVELEVTDHITEWIENDMAANGFSFEESFERMGKIFTKKDCRDIVRSKSKSLRRKIARDCWKEFASYFSWPKIALLFLLITVMALCDKYLQMEKFVSIYFHVFNLIVMLSFYYKEQIIQRNSEDMKQPLVGVKQTKRIQFVMNLPMLWFCIVCLFSLGEYQYPLWANKLLLYVFPVAILAGLSCKKVMISVHEKIRKEYPMAFE